MPIAAGQSILQSQIKSALSLDVAAQPQTFVAIVIAALSSVIPMGLLPSAPSPIPLTPAGISAAQSNMDTALNLGPAAQIDTTAALIALAVSLAAPLAPPAGLSNLQSQIANALSMQQAANIDMTAQLIALSIIQYYTMGGII